jgi:hypothetical protein
MIGVSPKQVKQMPTPLLLPPATGFRVQQSTGRMARSSLTPLDRLLVVTSATAPDSLLRTLPEIRELATTARRLDKAGEHKILQGRLGAATGVSWARLPAVTASSDQLPEPYALLRQAGEWVADALGDAPRSLGVLIAGFDGRATRRLADAILLATGGRSWQGPAFRRTVRPPTLRTLHFFGLAQKFDFARTLVEIENTNLVRWLTALPANKLTTESYRLVVESLARKHGWEFRFLDAACRGRGVPGGVPGQLESRRWWQRGWHRAPALSAPGRQVGPPAGAGGQGHSL